MLLAALALLVAAPFGAAQETGMQAAIRLVQEERYAQALGAAEREVEPIARAQGRVYVLHQAGDLRGALTLGREGLRSHPDDAWLLRECADIALSLHDARLGRELLERLAATGQPGSEAPLLRGYLDGLEALAQKRARALLRARWTVVLGLGAALLALMALAWRASPRP